MFTMTGSFEPDQGKGGPKNNFFFEIFSLLRKETNSLELRSKSWTILAKGSGLLEPAESYHLPCAHMHRALKSHLPVRSMHGSDDCVGFFFVFAWLRLPCGFSDSLFPLLGSHEQRNAALVGEKSTLVQQNGWGHPHWRDVSAHWRAPFLSVQVSPTMPPGWEACPCQAAELNL